MLSQYPSASIFDKPLRPKTALKNNHASSRLLATNAASQTKLIASSVSGASTRAEEPKLLDQIRQIQSLKRIVKKRNSTAAKAQTQRWSAQTQ